MYMLFIEKMIGGEEMGLGFGIFEVIFALVFILVIFVFVLTFIKGISQWNKNNNSPRLTVPATVVAKRINVSYHRHANVGDASGTHGFHRSSSTSYYVTFQFESGDRMEMNVSGYEYGLLVEGDCGKLSFQGTRYLGFERT